MFSSQREILRASMVVSKNLERALAGPNSMLILHRSQWRCLARSYAVVIEALAVLFDHTCSKLMLSEQQSMYDRLTQPLEALHQTVRRAETFMQQTLPSSSASTHSWLVEKALKLGMSTDVMDIHLLQLLWSSSVVQEHILRSAQIDGMEAILSDQTRDLCKIWAEVDPQDDFQVAETLLNRIISEEEGESCQLARFILQKLSYFEDRQCVRDIGELPSFMWVDPNEPNRNPDVLGSGAYGKVHEAVWLGAQFAIKDFFYVENKEQFGREAAIQAHLQHPNVMPLVCCTKKPSVDKCSLVMELMQQDLRDLMIQRMKAGIDPPFPLLLAVDLMLQIAQGMEYLHSLGIIHRDLKSFNILVSFPNGGGSIGSSYIDDVRPLLHLRVSDFGMSKSKIASSRYTTKETGSTQWRAPEVFEDNRINDTKRYTNKADVYSFSIVCSEILTGKLPFEGCQIKRRVMGGERPKLPEYCPIALSSYIERCWHVKAKRRPTFTQICRILRYIKACLFLQDHDQDQYANCLLCHISSPICDRIDGMLQGLLQQCGTSLRPNLLVPLEMYCCSKVLQEFLPKTEVHRRQGKSVYGISTLQTRKNSVVFERSKQKVKGLNIGRFLNRNKTKNDNPSSVIKHGRSGSVYLGTLADSRKIAVKIVQFQGLKDGRSLLQEMQIARHLRHQTIVPLYGWSQHREELLLLYEYMPHGDLGKHIHGANEGPLLNWQQRYKVVCQLAEALKYLHGMDIVHRDVTIGNILLDTEWNARLGKCGLGFLFMKEGQSFVNGTITADTRGYVAPEIVEEGRSVSSASDIYSFGVTVLEITSGRRAYSARRYLDVWARDLYERGELMQAADVRLGGNFDEVEMKRLLHLGLSCTNEQPHERPTIAKVIKILSAEAEPELL